MTSTKKILAVLCVALSLQACSRASDLKPGGTGKKIVFENVTYDQVWDGVIAGIQRTEDDRSLDISRKLSITLQDKRTGRIEAETSMSLWSIGEVVGVYVTPAEQNAPRYTVEVESLTKVKTNVFAKNWEDQLLASIKKQIAP